MLGSLAGLYDLLIILLSVIFGNYIQFISNIKWIRHLFYFKIPKHDLGLICQDHGNLKHLNFNLTWIYFKNYSFFKFLFKGGKLQSNKEKRFIEILEKGRMRLEKAFNFSSIICSENKKNLIELDEFEDGKF